MTADFVHLHDDGFRIELCAETPEDRLILKFLEDHLFNVAVVDGKAHFWERYGRESLMASV